ncbi:hypothetical protein ACFV4N_06190 [Actinosynnema sp. NPDC059797]
MTAPAPGRPPRSRAGGWPHPFREQPWDRIAAWFHEVAAQNRHYRHMADIVDSVRACGGEERLAGLTSMHDLVVTPRPVRAAPPVEVVVVRAPSSGLVGEGGVLIAHWSTTGRDDEIHRPADEAVPLFWRFVIEKFGVEPVRPLSSG